MHVIIPMSGIGKRFIEAGYTVPKPLIEVDGIPMIHHVIDLFQSRKETTIFHFIVKASHYDTTEMDKIIVSKVPKANIYIIPDEIHMGPVYAVKQIFGYIPNNEEVIVSYCDYGTKWNYEAFIEYMHRHSCDGGIASYTGFHPHLLGKDNYAYMQEDNGIVSQIQEKSPYKDNKMDEIISNGTYYFRTGRILKKYFQQLIDEDTKINGEFYVSLVYNLMIQNGLHVRHFFIDNMLQWGTPFDLEVYQMWSNYFKIAKKNPMKATRIENAVLLLPMAGSGSRFYFTNEYTLPKPLLPIHGNPMVIEAVSCLPPTKEQVFICLEEHLSKHKIINAILQSYPTASIVGIPHITDGQATTCKIGIDSLPIPSTTPILISACDNGVYYNVEKYYELVDDLDVDVIVWSFTNNPTSSLYPEMYAWLDVDNDGFIRDVSIKKPFTDRENKYAIIGTMFFRSSSIFLEGLKEIYEKNIRTNGEFYVDNVIVPLIKKGYKVKNFSVDYYLCWGTPNDYKTYFYWEEYFTGMDV